MSCSTMIIAFVLVFVVSCFLHTTAQDVAYQPIGCFGDNANERALPTLVHNFRPNIDWNDLSKIVKMCAQATKKKGFNMVFSLQFYGECWSGAEAGLTYDRYGPSDNCDERNQVGKQYTNFVYRFNSTQKT